MDTVFTFAPYSRHPSISVAFIIAFRNSMPSVRNRQPNFNFSFWWWTFLRVCCCYCSYCYWYCWVYPETFFQFRYATVEADEWCSFTFYSTLLLLQQLFWCVSYISHKHLFIHCTSIWCIFFYYYIHMCAWVYVLVFSVDVTWSSFICVSWNCFLSFVFVFGLDFLSFFLILIPDSS